MRTAFACFLVLAALTGGCTYEQQQPLPCVFPDTVSFRQDIQPIFAAHCTSIDCHAGLHPAGNLHLESDQAYAELSDPRSGYVDTLQPRISVLYAQMISVSNPMPPSGNLDDCTIALVLTWIEQKARNN